jgi:hypothetical protein
MICKAFFFSNLTATKRTLNSERWVLQKIKKFENTKGVIKNYK